MTARKRQAEWSATVRAALVDDLPADLVEAVWVTGSVGRGEAGPGSDVESLAVAYDPAVAEALAARTTPIGLDGPPLWAPASPVSATDPRLIRDARGWGEHARACAEDPGSTLGVVVLGLLADARPLDDRADDPDLLPRCVQRAIDHRPEILDDVLADALSVTASVPSRPARLLGGPSEVDVKQQMVTPLVKLARWRALRAGICARSTVARLAPGLEDDLLDEERWDELAVAARAVADLRWETRRRGDPDTPGSDVIRLDQLSPSERALLRSAARSIAGAQRTIGYLRGSGTLTPRPTR